MNEIYEYDQNAIGKIEIAPEVIQIISGIAAASVEGVIGLSGGTAANINQLLGRKNLKKGNYSECPGRYSFLNQYAARSVFLKTLQY